MIFKDKYNEIKDGWKNYIFPNPEVEKIAEQRAVICASCENNKLGVCQLCFCPLKMKTKSMKSNCPANKWPNINLENKII